MTRKKLPAKDRHKSGFMVRLPESFRELLDELVKESHRTMTVEVQLALSDYAKAKGKKPPEVGS